MVEAAGTSETRKFPTDHTWQQPRKYRSSPKFLIRRTKHTPALQPGEKFLVCLLQLVI
jgi:hypothetical protein